MKCRCECGWIGNIEKLISIKEDPENKTYCPQCKSSEVFFDEEFED
jgi:hypothetical protein